MPNAENGKHSTLGKNRRAIVAAMCAAAYAHDAAAHRGASANAARVASLHDFYRETYFRKYPEALYDE